MIKNKNGFTLIEVAIVLIIIGLVISGILVGQDLIKSSIYKKIASEKAEFERAAATFRSKYNCIPGDCGNAYDYFGSTCGTNATGISAGCNGDGNGLIDDQSSNAHAFRGEQVKFWQHLSLAQLINFNYSKDATNTTNTIPKAIIGSTIPPAALNSLAWGSTYCGNMDLIDPDGNGIPPSQRGFCLGGDPVAAGGGTEPVVGSISFSLAFTLDSKFDDGIPNTGIIRGDTTGNCMGSSYSNSAAPGSAGWDDAQNSDCTLTFLY